MSKQPESEDKYRVDYNPDYNDNMGERQRASQPNGINGNGIGQSNIKNEKEIALQLKDNKEKVLRGGFPSNDASDSFRNTPLSQSEDRDSFSKSSKMKDSKQSKTSILKKSRYGKSEDIPRPNLVIETGNAQLKSDRKEKISFKQDLHEIKVVENWKDYNNDNYDSTTCHCNTF